MIDLTFLQWIGSLGGVGAVFGIIMFMVLMKIMQIMREDRKFMEDRLTGIISSDVETRKENTIALTELIIWLKAKNGANRG